MELTIEQRKALALAAARKRQAESVQAPVPEPAQASQPQQPTGMVGLHGQPIDRNPIADMIGGLEAGGGLSPEQEAGGEWFRGMLSPTAHNRKTGEWQLAVPGLVQGLYEGAKDAFALPGDVLSGKYNDELDPRVSKENLSPELIGRGLNMAAFATPGTRLPGRAPSPVDAARMAGAQEADQFAIPLTRGQADQNLRQLTREEGLRQVDGPAQPIMRQFDETQREAIGGATEDITRQIGGNPDDLAGAAVGGVRDRVKFSQERTSALHDIAENGDLVIKAEAVQAMPAFVKERITASPIIMDPTVTPTAVAAWKLIEEAGMNAGNLNTSIKGIEQIRKRLVGLQGVSREDRAATRTVKKAFDDWLDDSIDQTLFSGDETALEALKAARAEARVYLSITNPKPGDAAGRAIAKMQQGDATPEQVANWLYGADIVSPNLNAPHVASRLKSTLGPTSPEWAAVRASAWSRLVKDMGTGEPRTATMIAKRLDNFLSNKGSSLSRVLFSEAERNRMKAFSAVLKRTVTPRDATNPSRSAFVLNNLMRGVVTSIMAAAGYAVGDVSGLAAVAAVPIFRNVMRKRAAKKAVRGPASASTASALGEGLAPNLAARALAFENPVDDANRGVLLPQ